jgi:hypothetical protein
MLALGYYLVYNFFVSQGCKFNLNGKNKMFFKELNAS